MTSPFDATLLTASEVRDITEVLQNLDELDHQLNGRILLGEIPVLDEDGLETIGYLSQYDDYQWRFKPAYSIAERGFYVSPPLPPSRDRHPDRYNPEGDDIA